MADITKANVLRDLIVHVESERKQELTHGSLNLITPDSATKFNEFDNRNAFGIVKGCPNLKDVKKGDTVWFHHNVVINQDNGMSMAKDKSKIGHQFRIDSEENLYLIPYSEKDFSLNCMAYLVEDSKTKEKKALNIFVFGEPVKKEELEDRSGLIIRNQHEYGFALECKIKYASDYAVEYGLKEGDIVGVTNNADYKMDIDGEDLWRFPVNSIAYVIKDGEFIPFNNYAIIKQDHKETKIGSFFRSLDSVKESDKATVIASGDRCQVEEGERIVHEGKMMYNLYTKEGEDYYLIRDNNITGVLTL